MKTNLIPSIGKKSGFLLVLTMCFLAVSMIIFAGVWYWSSSNSIQTARNVQYVSSQAAAEAATERVLATMMRDYLSQSLTNQSYYQTLVPSQNTTNSVWPVNYAFSDSNGVTNQVTVSFSGWSSNTVPLTSQFAGLYGLANNVTITAKAAPIGQQYTIPATVSEGLQFASIPIFQFAIFYNLDLEIDPGSTMNITGPVFSNAGLWLGNGNVTYSSTVQAVGDITKAGNDPFCSGKSDSGNSTYAFQPQSPVPYITMPIGGTNAGGVEAILQLPPSTYALGTAGAYTTNGQLYVANEADLIVSNAIYGINYPVAQGTNLTLWFQDSARTTPLTPVPYDLFLVTNTATKKFLATNYVTQFQLTNILNINYKLLTNYSGAVMFAGYSFLTNVMFYDAREGWSSASLTYGKQVQAVQIDVAKFNIWLTNSAATNNGIWFNNQCNTDKGHTLDSVYVYNGVSSTSVSMDPNSTYLAAVRVVNGSKLPSSYGFTVATASPIYVLGHYNITGASGTKTAANNATAGYSYPAALMGDSVTILSGSWSDTPHVKGSPTTPTATTVNAACLEGIVQSSGSSYSGGVENFLRLLESWTSSIQLTYNGSIVVMFPSQYATGAWNGSYYGVPKRAWAFDLNYRTQNGLPPLTPQVKAVVRAFWR